MLTLAATYPESPRPEMQKVTAKDAALPEPPRPDASSGDQRNMLGCVDYDYINSIDILDMHKSVVSNYYIRIKAIVLRTPLKFPIKSACMTINNDCYSINIDYCIGSNNSCFRK